MAKDLQDLTAFDRGEFTDEYKKTIGVDFLEKHQYVESVGEDVKLMVWDTAGQEEFDSITRTYYRGTDASAYEMTRLPFASL